ncbi:MAG: hypothetical protein D3923_08455, partial [Candidatus Electrothrix sp. AR3]|nr:hypothetical protein [Candidatus Electrothrix sp. AR3]
MPPTKVIPTCVDISKFHKKEIGEIIDISKINFGYIGSLGEGYLAEEIFLFFSRAKEVLNDCTLTILTRTDKNIIHRFARKYSVSNTDMEIKKVNHQDVPSSFKKVNVGLSFIKPHYSKIASC